MQKYTCTFCGAIYEHDVELGMCFKCRDRYYFKGHFHASAAVFDLAARVIALEKKASAGER